MRHEVLIGTYTRRGAEGIYRGTFDDEIGAFETLELAVATDNPAFLIARGGCVYAVNEQTEGGRLGVPATGRKPCAGRSLAGPVPRLPRQARISDATCRAYRTAPW